VYLCVFSVELRVSSFFSATQRNTEQTQRSAEKKL
jgi:hypothetical protein